MSLWSIWSGSVSPSPPRIVRLYVHKHSQQSPLSELSHVIGIYLTFSVQFPTLLSTIKIVKPATNTPNVMGFVSLYSILLISIQNRIVKFTRKKTVSHKLTLWISTLWPGKLLTLLYPIDWLCMQVNADFVAGIVWTKSASGNPGWQVPRWNIGCIFVHFCKVTINRRASLLQWLKPRDNKKLCTAPLSCKCQHGPEKILFVSHDYTFWRLLLLALCLRWSMTWKTRPSKMEVSP